MTNNEQLAEAVEQLRHELACLRGDLLSFKALVSPAEFEEQAGRMFGDGSGVVPGPKVIEE